MRQEYFSALFGAGEKSLKNFILITHCFAHPFASFLPVDNSHSLYFQIGRVHLYYHGGSFGRGAGIAFEIVKTTNNINHCVVWGGWEGMINLDFNFWVEKTFANFSLAQ